MLYFFLLYVKKKYILGRYENEWAVKKEKTGIKYSR